MKQLLVLIIIAAVNVSSAQDASTTPSVPGPSTGVEPGRPSKEQRKAMREALEDEKNAVDSACAEEAKIAGCTDKSVGSGLLKCIREHRRAAKDFKVSEGCKTAMKALRSERKKIKNK